MYQALVKELDQGTYPHGSKLPTEKELCERFAVSRTTIRKAVACLSDMGRVAIRQGAGIYASDGGGTPGGSVRAPSSTVSVSMSMRQSTARQLQTRLLRAGLMPCLFNQSDEWWDPATERLFLERVLAERHRALIGMFSPRAPRNDDLFRELEAAGIHVVHLEPYHVGGPEQQYCLPDHRLAGQMAATELMLRGAEHVTMLRMSESPFEILALAGFDQSVATHRRATRLPDGWLLGGHTPELVAEAAAQLRDWLREIPPCTGIFCRSLENAILVQAAAAALGRTTTDAEDLSLLCLTESPADVAPGIISLAFDREAMLATVIGRIMAPRWQPIHQILPPILIDPQLS